MKSSHIYWYSYFGLGQMVAEALLALWFGWSRFDLAVNDNALCTFSFLTLLYFAAFSIVSARERRWFWATRPSAPVMAAVVAEVVIGTALTFAGLPGLAALPWPQALALFAYAMVACLFINDAVKVAMIRWHVSSDTVGRAPWHVGGDPVRRGAP